MIIQINATVCAAVDHGDDRRRRIADSDQRRRVLGRKKMVGDQGKQESLGA